MKTLALAVGALALLTACSGEERPEPPPVDPPPNRSAWPPYPVFPAQSCWARPLADTSGAHAAAPSVLPRAPGRTASPEELLRRLRDRFGDRTLIVAAELGHPPPITFQHTGYYGRGVRPPRDGVWLYLRIARSPRAEWEADLFAGALRDELCLSRSRPFVGWSTDTVRGVSDATFAFGQRFPNPSPAEFRRRLGAVARAYDFRVLSVRFLRPLQLAPIVTVEADDRERLARDAPAIIARLNPSNGDALTFEGLWFEARDEEGPFLRLFSAHRGISMGGHWAWDPCRLPHTHLSTMGLDCEE